jgi:hypothetical protein
VQGNSTPGTNIFYKHKLFSTISILQKQILNPTIYFKQWLFMEIFVWATTHDVNMHAKIQNIIKYRYL